MQQLTLIILKLVVEVGFILFDLLVLQQQCFLKLLNQRALLPQLLPVPFAGIAHAHLLLQVPDLLLALSSTFAKPLSQIRLIVYSTTELNLLLLDVLKRFLEMPNLLFCLLQLTL